MLLIPLKDIAQRCWIQWIEGSCWMDETVRPCLGLKDWFLITIHNVLNFYKIKQMISVVLTRWDILWIIIPSSESKGELRCHSFTNSLQRNTVAHILNTTCLIGFRFSAKKPVFWSYSFCNLIKCQQPYMVFVARNKELEHCRDPDLGNLYKKDFSKQSRRNGSSKSLPSPNRSVSTLMMMTLVSSYKIGNCYLLPW